MIKKIILLWCALHSTAHCMESAWWNHGYELQQLTVLDKTSAWLDLEKNIKMLEAEEIARAENYHITRKPRLRVHNIMQQDNDVIKFKCRASNLRDTCYNNIVTLNITTGIYKCISQIKYPYSSAHHKITREIAVRKVMSNNEKYHDKQENNDGFRNPKGPAFIHINDTRHHLQTARGNRIFGLTAFHITRNLAIGCTEKSWWDDTFDFWSCSPYKKWYLFSTEISDDTYYDKPTPIVIMRPLYAIPELDSRTQFELDEVQNVFFTEDGNTILAFFLDGKILKITPQIRKKNVPPHHKTHDMFFRWE